MLPGANETEWQFDAVDLRAVLRSLDEHSANGGAVQISADKRVTPHTDLYLDTEDHRIHRAGYALRIRRVGRRQGGEATLKSLEADAPTSGLRERREVTQPLARAEPEMLLSADGPVSERVRAVAGRKSLVPLFNVRTRRRAFSVLLEGHRAGELALDESTIAPANAAPTTSVVTRLRRVELEVSADDVSALEPFVDELRTTCGLHAATLSKYETGLLVGGLRPVDPDTFGAVAIEPHDSTGSVAVAVLRRHFSAFLEREPGTRLGDDSEELHDMRVASRRLRAALSLFADVVPPRIMRLREDLRWIGAMLGDVRDLDVQLDQLAVWLAESADEDRAALDPLRLLLEEQRSTARRAMLGALDSRRYETFVDRFARALRTAPPRIGAGAVPILETAPALIDARYRAFRRAGDRIHPGSKPAEYHRLRIRGKRLRYALELLADVYPGETRTPVKRLVALQDILGLHQDGDVAIRRLHDLTRDREHPLEPATVFAMGGIAERYRRSMDRLRRRVPAAYAKVTGKSWTTFSKLMERNRPSPTDAAD